MFVFVTSFPSLIMHAKYQCCICVSALQESQWLDSVSLLIKDSLEGDLIDNLSGSVFHHYGSPPICKDCKSHPQEVISASHTQTLAKHNPKHLLPSFQIYKSVIKCHYINYTDAYILNTTNAHTYGAYAV